MSTAQPLLTAQEFALRYDNHYMELVKGRVIATARSSPRHGKICTEIGRVIANHVKAMDLGHTMSNDSFIQTKSNPDCVRGPDVCYFSYERLPRGPVPEGLLPVAPDLVVEVRSVTDLWTEVFTKVIEYLQANVRVVIVLDPKTETASVYRPDELQQILHNSDALTIPEVLPGFSVQVQTLFA